MRALKETFGHLVSKDMGYGTTFYHHGLCKASSVISIIHSTRHVQIQFTQSALRAALLNYSMEHTFQGQGLVTGCFTADISASEQQQTGLTLEFTSQSGKESSG